MESAAEWIFGVGFSSRPNIAFFTNYEYVSRIYIHIIIWYVFFSF